MPNLNTDHLQLRAQIAANAARLVAQEGADYATARRKAARQVVGVDQPAPNLMPDNIQIEEEVRKYLALFGVPGQAERLAQLRTTALQVMDALADFHPYLTGAALNGTAGEHDDVHLQLFADSAKEVEIFLLNRGIPYTHDTPRNDRAEAVLVVDSDDAVANLVIYPPLDERISPKGRDGRPRERARLAAVQELIAAEK